MSNFYKYFPFFKNSALFPYYDETFKQWSLRFFWRLKMYIKKARAGETFKQWIDRNPITLLSKLIFKSSDNRILIKIDSNEFISYDNEHEDWYDLGDRNE